jgi:hypothetical protein
MWDVPGDQLERRGAGQHPVVHDVDVRVELRSARFQPSLGGRDVVYREGYVDPARTR